MEILVEVLGIAGFVFAATAAGVLVYEREADVLHGLYIEGRVDRRVFAAMLDPLRALVAPLIDRLNWQARGAVYLAAMA